MERYFTKVGYSISATWEDDHLIYPQNFSYNDFFIYAIHYNNVVSLLSTTPDIWDIPEADIPDEYVVDTIWDDTMEAMEHKVVRSVMTLIIYVVSNMKCMVTLTVCLVTLIQIVEINIQVYFWTDYWRKISCGGTQYCLFIIDLVVEGGC